MVGVTSRRDFARTLNDSLEHVATIPAYDFASLHRRLQSSRDFLIANDAALHKARDPWKLCVFDMRERFLAIPESAHTKLRLSTKAAHDIDIESFERLAGEIEEWVGLGGHKLAENHPEWSRSTVTTAKEARQSFELVSDLAENRLPAARDALFTALDEMQLPRPETVPEWGRAAQFLVVASGSRWGRIWTQLISREYRKTKRALGAPSSLSLTPEIVGKLKVCVCAFVAGLADFSAMAGIDELDDMPYTDLASTLERMVSSRIAVVNLPRIRELEAQFREVGIGNVIECVGKDISPEYAARAVEYAWLRRILDDLDFEDQRIATFDSSTHSRHRDEFVETDRQHRDFTPQRVRRLTAEAIIATMNNHPQGNPFGP